MRIAMVAAHTNPLVPGGLGAHVRGLAHALAGRGHQVRIYAGPDRTAGVTPWPRVNPWPGVEVVHTPAAQPGAVPPAGLVREMSDLGAFLATAVAGRPVPGQIP